MTTIKGRELSAFFFDSVNEHTWKCKLCKKDYRVSGTGFTNLKTHVTTQHEEEYQEYLNGNTKVHQSDLEKHRYTVKTKQLFGWLDFIIMTLTPFSFVENSQVRKHIKHGPISINTFYKYMEQLVIHVEEKIRKVLPNKFSLVFEGLATSDTHYIGLFALFPRKKGSGNERVLLSFSPFLEEQVLDSDEYVRFIEYNLSMYDKSILNVICITGENCYTNKSVATKLGCRFIGCASHRLNLAVKDVLAEYREIINQVNCLMKKLQTASLSALLRTKTHLRPILKYETTGSSCFDMLNSYLELREVLQKLDNKNVQELMPTLQVGRKIEKLCSQLEKMNSVAKTLQSDTITIADVRVLFDRIIKEFPTTAERLSINTGIADKAQLEPTILEITENAVNDLINGKKESVADMKYPVAAASVSVATETMSFAQRPLKKRRLSHPDGDSSCIDPHFVLPMSNFFERLSPITEYALRATNNGVSPARFELQIFLHINGGYWGIHDISEIMKKMEK